MADFKETCIEYIDADKKATFCSSERKWINKIYKLKEKYPNDVHIEVSEEDNDGMIIAHIPKSWMKVSPPAKRNFTDEQKAAMAERMRAARNNT
jgi:hypothetical protein